MSRPRDWDAPAYDRVAAPIEALGHGLLEQLELRGDETVLDAGCGSGAVTSALLDRLPEALRDEFLDEVLIRLPSPPTLRHVRLTLSARRAR